ncbi:MAG: hypothetical protein EZS28_043823, partial [Streblomastix strix]
MSIYEPGYGNGVVSINYQYFDEQSIISDCQFTRCALDGNTCGALSIQISYNGQLSLINTAFFQCKAQYAGAIYAYVTYGGKIIIDGDCSFIECESPNGNGGAIYSSVQDTNSQLILNDGVKIYGCTGYTGSGISLSCSNYGTCEIGDIEIKDCEATYEGGG